MLHFQYELVHWIRYWWLTVKPCFNSDLQYFSKLCHIKFMVFKVGVNRMSFMISKMQKAVIGTVWQ